LSRDSQEAYEIASHGLIRPDIKQAGPVVFGMKCIHFEPPEFILGEFACLYIYLCIIQLTSYVLNLSESHSQSNTQYGCIHASVSK